MLLPVMVNVDEMDTVVVYSRRVRPELGQASATISLMVSGRDLGRHLQYDDIPPDVTYGVLNDRRDLLWLETRQDDRLIRRFLTDYQAGELTLRAHPLSDSEVRETVSMISGDPSYLAAERIGDYGLWAAALMPAAAALAGPDSYWRRYQVFGGSLTALLLMWAGAIHLMFRRQAESQALLRQNYGLLQQREQELEASKSLLKSLVSREITSRDAEESRIAREIHDDLGQRLAVLRMDVAQLSRRGEVAGDPVLAGRFGALMAQISDTIAAMRAIVRSIMPVNVELGLKTALQALVDDFAAKSGISLLLLVELPEDLAIDERLSFTVYRIVQEALTNIANHADASHGLVLLELGEGELTLTVSDNGKGFAPDGHTPGFGLKSIRERAMMMGGSVDLTSDEGTGVSIQVRFPL